MQTLMRVIAVTLWIGWLNLLPARGSDLRPEQVLQALRESDRALLQQQGCSMILAAEVPKIWFPITVSYRLRATSNQRATVVIKDQFCEDRLPSYSALLQRERQSGALIHTPPGQDIPYLRCAKNFYLAENNYYVEVTWLESLLISPQGTVTNVLRGSVPADITIHPSSNCLTHSSWKFGLRALGRGFSQYLGEALSVKELPDGRIEFWATYKYEGVVFRSRWKLIIDPSRQFLVVEAELINPNGTVRAQFQTEGIVEAPIPLARRGTMHWHLDDAPPEVSRFECVSYEPCFRTDWYEEVRRIIRRPPAGTEVIDRRVKPFTTFTIK